jgi:AhpD family alkylhydroperoxidase
MYRPDTGKPLYELAGALLRGESTLSQGERELIATYVSHLNSCQFCMSNHAAAARYLFKDEKGIVDVVLEIVAEARSHGATDREIHDTVLIAATFCMFNRYVDGLASFTPADPKAYEEMGKRMVEKGYVLPTAQPSI